MNEIMTLEEVAKYLKMKPQTIYGWAQKGKIPAAKIGKEWRFRRDIIDAWFIQHIDEKFQPLLDQMDKRNNKRKEESQDEEWVENPNGSTGK